MYSEHPPSDENYSVNQISHCFILVSPMLFKWITYTALSTDKLRGWKPSERLVELGRKGIRNKQPLCIARSLFSCHALSQEKVSKEIWSGTSEWPHTHLGYCRRSSPWYPGYSRRGAFHTNWHSPPSDQLVNRHPQKILNWKFVLTTNNQSIPDIHVGGVRRQLLSCSPSQLKTLAEDHNRRFSGLGQIFLYSRVQCRCDITFVEVHWDDIHSSRESRMTVIRIFLHRPLFFGLYFKVTYSCWSESVQCIKCPGSWQKNYLMERSLEGNWVYCRKEIGSQRHLLYR